MKPDDNAPGDAERHPSAKAMVELEALTKKKADGARAKAAWRAVTGAAANPDFHVVLDYACEHEFVLPCEQTDHTAANLTWTNPIDGSEMVWIPAGKFIYGTKGKTAECAGFSLARWPVTNAQYAEFLRATNYSPPANHPDNELFLQEWDDVPPKGEEKHPVTWVSLFDALAYCGWAGMTLPTEWLWEKAARGTDGRPHPWGAGGYHGGKKLAHVSASETCAVGKYAHIRSPYGCEELIGNVSEWCFPMPAKAPVGQFPPHDPPAIPAPSATAYTVVRGACFLRDSANTMKASHQRNLSQTRRNQWVGFRPACLLPLRPV
jgi:serine/threonine-protein kinase